jgi:hypothetical protein
MTAILTEVQKTDELVKLAREQIDAFNKGDWGLLATRSWEPSARSRARRRSSSSSKVGSRRSRTQPAR